MAYYNLVNKIFIDNDLNVKNINKLKKYFGLHKYRSIWRCDISLYSEIIQFKVDNFIKLNDKFCSIYDLNTNDKNKYLHEAEINHINAKGLNESSLIITLDKNDNIVYDIEDPYFPYK